MTMKTYNSSLVLSELGKQAVFSCQHFFLTMHKSASKRIALLALAREKSRQRRQLKQLTEAQLSDMGITPSMAVSEAKKPFWH